MDCQLCGHGLDNHGITGCYVPTCKCRRTHQHADHPTYAQLAEAVRLLGEECAAAKKAFTKHPEVHTLAMNVNWPKVHAYNAATCRTDANPTALRALEGGE